MQSYTLHTGLGVLGCRHPNQLSNAYQCSGVLTDDDFSFEGVSYGIMMLEDLPQVNQVYFALNGRFRDNLKRYGTLVIGSRSFRLQDATISNIGGSGDGVFDNLAKWPATTRLGWSAGDQIPVKLVYAPPEPTSLTLSATDTAPREGGGPVTVTATLDRPAGVETHVNVLLRGTATWREGNWPDARPHVQQPPGAPRGDGSEALAAGADYWTPAPADIERGFWFGESSSGSVQAGALLTIPAGQRSASFEVRILDDAHNDNGETIEIEAQAYYNISYTASVTHGQHTLCPQGQTCQVPASWMKHLEGVSDKLTLTIRNHEDAETEAARLAAEAAAEEEKQRLAAARAAAGGPLSGLALTAGSQALALVPAFSPGVTSYRASAPAGTTGVSLAPSWGALAELGGPPDVYLRSFGPAPGFVLLTQTQVRAAGASAALALAPDGPTKLEVTVLERDGSETTTTYRIEVTGAQAQVQASEEEPAQTPEAQTPPGEAEPQPQVQAPETAQTPEAQTPPEAADPQPQRRQPAAPLTAAFEDVPAEHDGGAFAFRVRFSEAPGTAHAATLRKAAFDVDKGTVKQVEQVEAGLWRVRVAPRSWKRDVRVALAGGRDCAADGAVCTADGRALENSPGATVPGPVRIKVAGGKAKEGRDATLAFAVTLHRAASGPVTVDYATEDRTASAGADYQALAGTLTFAAGETAKTVAVALLDDAVDEGRETFRLRLSNAAGARILDDRATGEIRNTDPLPGAWLSRFGRTGAGHVVGMLDARFEAAAQSGDRITLGGRTVDMAALRGQSGGQPAGDAGDGPEVRPQPATWGRDHLTPDGPAYHGQDTRPAPDATPLERALWQALTRPGSLNVDPRRFLSQSSFQLSLTDALRASEPATDAIETARALPDHPGHWSLWGRGALTRFQGTDNGVHLDGDVLTGLVGVDYARDRWLAGVALAWHDGDGAYRAPGSGTGGDLDSTLITVSPYLRYALTPRLSAWGALGYGAGTLELQPGRRDTRGQSHIAPDPATGHGNEEVALTPPVPTPSVMETDMTLGMGALGLRGVVYAGARTELALKSDALWVRTESKETAGLRGAQADTRRLRLLLSGQHQRALANDALLTPTVELGIRYDGGDAETGFGMELGGGLGYADAALGLTVQTRARALIAHEDGGYEEWGLGGSLSLDPGRLGRGLALRLDSGWGMADGSAEALWQRQSAAGLAPRHGPAAQARLNAELGYGLDVPWTRGVLTPYGGLAWAGPARTLTLGWRFHLGRQLSLSLDGERREDAHAQTEHALMLRTSLPW